MRKDIKTLTKNCEYCGEKLVRKRFNGRLEDFNVFKNRKYCNRNCMSKSFLKVGNHMQTKSNSRATARNINKHFLKKTKCEICGSEKNIDIHHIDENEQNNELDNLQILCRSCHMKIHHPKPKCKICGKPVKGHGYCNKHYIRYKKYGDPLYLKNKGYEL